MTFMQPPMGRKTTQEEADEDVMFEEAWTCEQCPPAPAGQLLPAGDLVARLLQLQHLAEASADALMLSQPLPPAEQAALLALWPSLLRLTAMPGAAAAAAGTPFAAAASIVLAVRASAGLGFTAGSLVRVSHPNVDHHGLGAAGCLFDLTAAPATAAQAAELQVFAHQLNRAIEQSSKEALEDTLTQLSRHPSPQLAIDAVRRSIEGQAQPAALRSSLRSMLLRRSSGSADCDSMASTPLRTSYASN